MCVCVCVCTVPTASAYSFPSLSLAKVPALPSPPSPPINPTSCESASNPSTTQRSEAGRNMRITNQPTKQANRQADTNYPLPLSQRQPIIGHEKDVKKDKRARMRACENACSPNKVLNGLSKEASFKIRGFMLKAPLETLYPIPTRHSHLHTRSICKSTSLASALRTMHRQPRSPSAPISPPAAPSMPPSHPPSTLASQAA